MNAQQLQLSLLNELLVRFSPDELREIIMLSYGNEFLRWLPSDKVGAGEFCFRVLERIQRVGLHPKFLTQIKAREPLLHPQVEKVAVTYGLVLAGVTGQRNEPITPPDAGKELVSRPSANHTTDTQGVHLGLLLTCPEELEALIELVPECIPVPDHSFGGYYYKFPLERAAHPTCMAVATFVSAQGTERTTLATDRFLELWRPRTLVLAGTATALRSDIFLGDVLVANQVDAYFNGVDGGSGDNAHALHFRPQGRVFQATHALLEAVLHFQFAHRPAFASWSEQGREERKSLQQQCEQSPHGGKSLGAAPAIRQGSLASGPVLGAGPAFAEWLRSRDSALTVIDTSSAGLLESAHARVDPARTLVLRGIAGYVTDPTAPLDTELREAIRTYAFRNVLRLVLTMAKGGALPGLASR